MKIPRIPRIPFQLKNIVLFLFCLCLAVLGWWDYSATGKWQFLFAALLGSFFLILSLFIAVRSVSRSKIR